MQKNVKIEELLSATVMQNWETKSENDAINCNHYYILPLLDCEDWQTSFLEVKYERIMDNLRYVN